MSHPRLVQVWLGHFRRLHWSFWVCGRAYCFLLVFGLDFCYHLRAHFLSLPYIQHQIIAGFRLIPHQEFYVRIKVRLHLNFFCLVIYLKISLHPFSFIMLSSNHEVIMFRGQQVLQSSFYLLQSLQISFDFCLCFFHFCILLPFHFLFGPLRIIISPFNLQLVFWCIHFQVLV